MMLLPPGPPPPRWRDLAPLAGLVLRGAFVIIFRWRRWTLVRDLSLVGVGGALTGCSLAAVDPPWWLVVAGFVNVVWMLCAFGSWLSRVRTARELARRYPW